MHLLPPKLVQKLSTSQNGVAQVAWLARLKPARCAVAKLRAACCAAATWAALPATPVCFHSFSQTRPILQCPGGLRHALIPAKVAICCKRVLGCHPHLSCLGKALGFGVVSFKACGFRRGLCPKQAVSAWAQHVTALNTGLERAICHTALVQ